MRAVRYELLLQPRDGAFDAAAVEQALEAKGAHRRPDGVFRLRVGTTEIECSRLVEAGAAVAMVLGVPLSEKLDPVRALVLEGIALAEALQLRLVDPQLAKDVGLADEGRIADQYLRTAQYAGRYAGVSEAVAASFGPIEPEAGLKPGTKALLGIAAVLAALWLIADTLIGPPPTPPAPRDGPPSRITPLVDAGDLPPLKAWDAGLTLGE